MKNSFSWGERCNSYTAFSFSCLQYANILNCYHYCPLSTLLLGCTVIANATQVHRAIENDISDWKMLGEELGINPTELDRIGRDQHGEQSRLRETIRVWQDRVPEDEFCWEKLIDALKSMKMIRVAKTISNQHHIKRKEQ